jgi:hypothetical protein
MSNLDVAVGSFWQLARHWKNGDKAKLELSCEDGSLQMQLSAVLGLTSPTSLTHLPLLTMLLLNLKRSLPPSSVVRSDGGVRLKQLQLIKLTPT